MLTHKDGCLAAKQTIARQDLMDKPLILLHRAIRRSSAKNKFIDWFKDNFEQLNIVATFNLVYNAAVMAKKGIKYVVGINGLADTSENSR